MVIVGKHINGITINPLEYLLDDDSGEAMKFISKQAAKAFLKRKGFSNDELDTLVFEVLQDEKQHSPGNTGERK